MSGWIKLFRQIKDWEYYKDIPTKTLFIHLLASAAYADYKIQKYNIIIPAGYYYTSIRQLSEETGLTVQEVRTALKKLNKREIDTTTLYNRTLIKIKNWQKYQEKETDTIKRNYDWRQYWEQVFIFQSENGREPNREERKQIAIQCDLNQVNKI